MGPSNAPNRPSPHGSAQHGCGADPDLDASRDAVSLFESFQSFFFLFILFNLPYVTLTWIHPPSLSLSFSLSFPLPSSLSSSLSLSHHPPSPPTQPPPNPFPFSLSLSLVLVTDIAININKTHHPHILTFSPTYYPLRKFLHSLSLSFFLYVRIFSLVFPTLVIIELRNVPICIHPYSHPHPPTTHYPLYPLYNLTLSLCLSLLRIRICSSPLLLPKFENCTMSV